MTVFDALAAAIRERLISGRSAPLPGLGTLVRQHVSARIEERPDGTRMLLPPGETIGLAQTDESHESLAEAFGRLRALPEADVEAAYAGAMDQLEARLAATGEVRLPGVGLLRRTSGGVVLGVEAGLLSAVNQAYEGLSPVGADPTSGTIESGEDATPAEPAAETTDEAPPPSPVVAEADTESAPADSEGEPLPTEAVDEHAADVLAPPVDASEPHAEESPVETARETPDGDAADADGEIEADGEAGIAVPFGTPSADAPADILPPTPPEADPSLADDDEWTSETWTSTTQTAAPGLLGTDPADLIEDADFEVLPTDPPPPTVERVSPEAEMEAMLSSPPPVTPPVPEATPPSALDPVPEAAVAPAEEASTSGGALGWILGVVVVALLAAALWAWSASRDDATTTDPEPIVTTTSPGAEPSTAPAAPDSTVAPGTAEAAIVVTDEPTGDTTAPASPSASEEAPRHSAPAEAGGATTAVSPPRLDGLDDGDRRAIAGGPIDPAMGGWTIIVASLRSESAANAESALYAEAGYRTGVFPPSERGQTRYRVGVGQFGSEDHARRLRDRLPPRAPADAWVLNLRTL